MEQFFENANTVQKAIDFTQRFERYVEQPITVTCTLSPLLLMLSTLGFYCLALT